jgi:hypothetical protein
MEKHIQWFHEVMKPKRVQDSKPVELESAEVINRAMGGKGDGWRMPDESWLEMETAKDRATFFINVVL